MNHLCECCNYNTTIKANFNKHLLSQKHKLKIENAFIKRNDINIQPKVSLTSTNACTKNKEDLTELLRLMNSQLENQNKQLYYHSKQIDHLMGKLEML